MRVLTWNLWWRYGPWQQRHEAIAAVLADVAPDVCGLQEVWSAGEENLAANLAARLGMHWCWVSIPVRPRPVDRGGSPTGEKLRIGNAILSRWPITAQAEITLPIDGHTDEHRVAAHARIEAPGGAFPFFTTHLSYGLGLSALRVQQVRAVAGFMAEHGDDGCAYPPVITGDFNADPDSDELRLLGGVLTEPAAPGVVLVDAWRYAPAGDPGFSWDLHNGYQAESMIPDSRIDYILVGAGREGRGQVRSVNLAGTGPVKINDGREVWPSDHFAVVADLAS